MNSENKLTPEEKKKIELMKLAGKAVLAEDLKLFKELAKY